MNEKEAMELMQNIDNDLIDSELDALMNGIEIDFESVSAKAHNKLNKERLKMKRRKLYPVAAAAMIAVVGLTSAYASELSAFVKSFWNTKEMYGTVVTGTSYYLENPVPLDGGTSLDTVVFTKDTLQMNLTYPLIDDKSPNTECRTKNGDIYTPGGYGTGENNELMLSFMNKDLGYVFSPAQEIELTIEGQSYTIQLTEAVSVAANGEIIPAITAVEENSGESSSQPIESHTPDGAEQTGQTQQMDLAGPVNIDWIQLGYKKTDKGIMVVTSFTDEELKLDSIGKPSREESSREFQNYSNGSTVGSGMLNPPAPLIGYDEEQNAYEFKPDEDADRSPVVQFVADNPDGKEITLKIPAIVVSYQKEYAEFSVGIPALNEKTEINREIDLQLQKMLLQSIERTSETTAELKFALNTGDQKEVRIMDAGVSSRDVDSGEVVWKDGVCTMQVTFEEELEDMQIWVGWPHFIVNGDWTLVIN